MTTKHTPTPIAIQQPDHYKNAPLKVRAEYEGNEILFRSHACSFLNVITEACEYFRELGINPDCNKVAANVQ